MGFTRRARFTGVSTQRYVYTTHGTEAQPGRVGDLESVIGEYAREGWRLSETLVHDGTTIGLVFEREVEPGS